AGAFDLYVSPADGVSDAELLLKTDLDKTPLSWSRDFLLYATRDPKTNDDLWVLPLHGERRPIPFAKTEFNESAGRFSPYGRWVAYVSNESGRNEVYVRAFSPTAPGSAGSGSITIVSRGGASDPRWNADGKELFYVGPNGSMMAVDVAPGPVFQPGSPRSLFQLPAGTVSSDTASDGRTLAVVPLQQASQAPFNVILNWQTGLKK